MTREYLDTLLGILEEAVEQEAVSHSLYEFLILKHFGRFGSRSLADMPLYKMLIREAVSKNKHGRFCSDSSWLSDAQDINMPLYIEHIKLYSEYVRLVRSNTKKTREPETTYQQMREKLVRKYSSVIPPEPTRKLTTKENQEYKQIIQWKRNTIDRIAELMIKLEKFDIK